MTILGLVLAGCSWLVAESIHGPVIRNPARSGTVASAGVGGGGVDPGMSLCPKLCGFAVALPGLLSACLGVACSIVGAGSGGIAIAVVSLILVSCICGFGLGSGTLTGGPVGLGCCGVPWCCSWPSCRWECSRSLLFTSSCAPGNLLVGLP